MADVHSPAVRSKNMRAIRSKNTKPELLVRKSLHAAGFRYRLHDKRLPGKPDIVLPKYRTVIFVHGCFWHGHDCKFFKLPQTRTKFWQEKIETNQARDREHIAQLIQLGWSVIVVWECEVKACGQGILDLIRPSLGKSNSDKI
ncbi:very short patch repair endonuclease [Ferrigenium kumadai]|uniref:very short patch repair endonuclease n=1 Tax=Ferrigenium kumadai TaxID=1682490 RepID=UPI001BB35D8D|nr:DNA mismatch endonuclease Vsr [Ferrigenium kumadai]